MSVGQALRFARTERKRTLISVAAEAGINPGFLSRVERGKRSPSRAVAERLAVVLGLPVDDVYHPRDICSLCGRPLRRARS